MHKKNNEFIPCKLDCMSKKPRRALEIKQQLLNRLFGDWG